MKRRALRGFVRVAVTLFASLLLMITGLTNAFADDVDVDLGTITYGQASFDASGEASVTTKLKTTSGARILLNVHVNPIPRSQIKRCWRVKPGTVILNEVLVPPDNHHAVVSWTVPANDNIFCTKKGFGKQVFKKSCGNRVWHVPGGPKGPPPLPRIRGKYVIRDYLSWYAVQTVKVTESGSASAHVVQRDDQGNVICEASGSVSGRFYIYVYIKVTVLARSTSSAKVTATHTAVINAQHDIKVKGAIETKVSGELEGQATAMCRTAPPPPPPPGNQPPQIQVVWPPHVIVGGSQAIWIEAKDPDGTVGTPVAINDSHATINSIIPVDVRFDGSPCPVTVSCFRGTLWGHVAGMAHLEVKVTDNSGDSASSFGDVEVVPDTGF